MAKILDKALIFKNASEALKPRTVTVPEWGGDVKYKPMTMTERREVRKKSVDIINDPNTGQPTTQVDSEMFEIYTLITCALDPNDESNNTLLFGPEDIPALESQIAAGGISTVAQEILKVSGLTGDSIFQGKEEA